MTPLEWESNKGEMVAIPMAIFGLCSQDSAESKENYCNKKKWEELHKLEPLSHKIIPKDKM